AALAIWDKPDSRYLLPDANPQRSGPTPVPPLSYIGPLGYVQFFCSGDIRNDANNLNFGISSGSDTVPPLNGILDSMYMYAVDRNTIIDVVHSRLYRARNISEGRVPDGSDRIGVFPNPTPGDAN